MFKGKDTLIIIKKDLKRNRYFYFVGFSIFLYYIIFHYWPMYGVLIAFKKFSPTKSIFEADWVGLKYFISFFNSYYFWRLIKNTLLISFYSLLFGFPAPILLALMLNEIRSRKLKKTIQTVTYLPHFISMVVICGIIVDFCLSNGIINDIIAFFGGERSNLLLNKDYFRTIYVTTNIWQTVGWGSIIYLAALAGIDQQLYDAVKIDGGSKWKEIIHVTIPGIMPTIVIMFILRIGKLMNIGAEKVLLLYNPVTYEVSDIINTFVFRKGLIDQNYSYATAVGLFNTIINLILVITANKISKKVNETSLW